VRGASLLRERGTAVAALRPRLRARTGCCRGSSAEYRRATGTANCQAEWRGLGRGVFRAFSGMYRGYNKGLRQLVAIKNARPTAGRARKVRASAPCAGAKTCAELHHEGGGELPPTVVMDDVYRRPGGVSPRRSHSTSTGACVEAASHKDWTPCRRVRHFASAAHEGQQMHFQHSLVEAHSRIYMLTGDYRASVQLAQDWGLAGHGGAD